MARLNIETKVSDYYPPRARWYSGVFRPWFLLRRALHLEKIHLPVGFTTQQFVLSLLVPGYAFFANGRRILGWSFLAGYFLAAALFLVKLGYQLGSFGYGMMISTHASSIVFLEGHWLRDQFELGVRLALSVLTLLVVWLAIYSPLTGFAERHWFMPLNIRGNVIIVHSVAATRQIERGDWAMYSLQEQFRGDAHRAGGAILVRSGFGWGPVLALAGDRVEFSTNSFAVNGTEHPLRSHMPTSGELIVPEKHWFVWPEFDTYSRGNVSEANVSALMMQLATVSEIEFIGKPFKHWFWRRQLLI